VITGCYPAFLFGGSPGSLLPVFHFHDVTREWLEPRLQYLVENGYRTVTSDEIARLAIDRVSPGSRAVALTFDDGWASAWTVAMPLLRQYGLRAILFAIPGRITEAEDHGPFVTWTQLRAMHESGVMDIQSHTWSHAMIFSGPELVSFVTPEYANEPLLERPLASASISARGAPPPHGHPVTHGTRAGDPAFRAAALEDSLQPPNRGGPRLGPGSSREPQALPVFVDPEALGTPLYVRRSRMSNARRYFPDESVAERCREHVGRNGGSDFFERPTWRADLEAIVGQRRDSASVERAAAAASAESDATRVTSIREELAAGRELLNDKLGTSSVRHVAFPWGICGEVARASLADTGFQTAFAQQPFRRRGVSAGDDRFSLMRLNGKFLTCLPGHGRKWFMTAVSDR
jgi:hypothetical protein